MAKKTEKEVPRAIVDKTGFRQHLNVRPVPVARIERGGRLGDGHGSLVVDAGDLVLRIEGEYLLVPPDQAEWLKRTRQGPTCCRSCGCTQNDAAHCNEGAGGCSWVEPDLCSSCAQAAEIEKAMEASGANKAIAGLKALRAGAKKAGFDL